MYKSKNINLKANRISTLKKLLLPFMLTLIFAAICHINTEAATVIATGTCGSTTNWELDDEYTLTITGSGTTSDYSESTQAPWGDYRTQIKKVEVKYGVTRLGNYAFYKCTNLESINLPDGFVSVGDYCFFIQGRALQSVILPDSMVWIGEESFANNYSLSEINFPANISNIGKYAFEKCALKNISIPSGTIKQYAFDENKSLTTVYIGANVTSISSDAFVDCSALSSITVDSANSNYSSEDGIWFNKNKTSLMKVPAAQSKTSYTVPDSVTSIATQAFEGSTTLTQVVMSDSVTSIGMQAFYGCKALKKVVLSGSLTTLPTSLFISCSSLTDVSIPENVTSIGNSAFSLCSSLEKIVIPQKVTSIGTSCFSNCSILKKIYFKGSAPTVSSNSFQYISSTATVYIPENDSTWTDDVKSKFPSTVSWDIYVEGMENEGEQTVTTYTVTYNANGGTGAPASQKKTEGEALTLSSTEPVRSGYTFVGWGTSSTSTYASYSKGGRYTRDENITLYAVWKKTLTLSYDANGGESAPASDSETVYNATTSYTFTIKVQAPSRNGYKFLGWNTDSGASSAKYIGGNTITISTDTTLYAVWEAITPGTYTVTYHANGGENAPGSQEKTEGVALILSEAIPSRTGYSFMGWGTSSTSTSASYQAGGTYTSNANITLYAIWKKTVTLSYNANGGSGAPSSQSGDMYNSATSINITISNTEPSRNNYTFLGWGSNSSSENVTYHSGDKITIDSDTIIYAVWKKNSDEGGESGGGESGGEDPVDPTPQPASKKSQTVTASGKTVVIKSKAFKLGAKTSGDGKLTYQSSNIYVATVSSSGTVTPKNYGETTITIKAAETETYAADITQVTITVVPKKMTIKSLKKAGKKKILLKWAKDNSVTGYQIQISLNKQFLSSTKSKEYKKSVTSKKITGLTSKKYWYVRMRSFKTINDEKFFGAWSTTKKIKVK